MGRKAKYTFEQKLKAVQDYLSGKKFILLKRIQRYGRSGLCAERTVTVRTGNKIQYFQ